MVPRLHLLMLYLGTSRPPKPTTSPPASLMEKGLQALRAVADRDRHALEGRLGGKQSSLGESAHPAGWFYRRLVRACGGLGGDPLLWLEAGLGVASPGSPKLVLVTLR